MSRNFNRCRAGIEKGRLAETDRRRGGAADPAFRVDMLSRAEVEGSVLPRLGLRHRPAIGPLDQPLRRERVAADVQAAVGIGVRKINLSSRLKQAFLGVLREACRVPDGVDPYEGD